MATNQELLARYVRDRSQEAFGELVARHLDLVYGSARRQVGNEALAQDVAQAVFIMLAQKAATLRANVILPAWLLTATWYACKNAMRREHRRRIHERGASLMRRETGDETALPDPQIGRELDEALMSLRESDRAAVVMHYLQGQTFCEVAVALHTTPEAARKRADRAVEKLRSFFRRRGVMMEPGALARGMSHQAALCAPASLAAGVLATVAGATATTAVAATGATGVAGASGGSAYALAQMTVQTMAAAGAKFAAAAVAALVLLTCASVAVYATTSRSRASNVSSAAATTSATTLQGSPLVLADSALGERPLDGARSEFPNALIAPIGAVSNSPNALNPTGGVTNGHFTFADDASVKRQPLAAPAASIVSPGPSLMPGMRGFAVPALVWRGKRIEVSAYLRTQDVRETTGMNVIIWGPQNRLLGSDMDGGPLRIAGTNEWMRMASVLDVPADAQRIEFGIGLWGSGRVWLDSFTMQAVDETAATTSDTLWHLATQFTSKYRLVNDISQPRNGRATARLESPGDGGAASRREWAELKRADRAIDAMRGKRIRIKAMIRCDNITGGAGLFANAGQFDAQRKYTQTESRRDLPVRGTLDWTAYATTLAVPAEASVLEYGVRIEGAGTLWIDDITVEVVP